ncbi:MAG: hypothetical protein RL346_938 [Verrucomicrobiota bacterium]|jgi:autotransporter-associated beta strand protein
MKNPFRISLPLASALAALLAAPQLHAIDYTWTSSSTGTLDWTDITKWLSSTVFVSGSSNALIFTPSATGNRWGSGTADIITNVPPTLSMNTLTLGGSAATSGNSIVNIAPSSSNWTIGDGTTSVVNLTGEFYSFRSLTYNVSANIALNQTTTTFTGNGTGIFNFTGVISGTDKGILKSGSSVLTLSNSANTYSGTTTATGGVLVATNTGALSGYNSAGKIIFNGGAIGARVGGSGWTTADVDTLLSNATKTSGQLAIDTTNGDVTQWANLTTANLGGLGIAKLGSNNLTLNQSGSYGGLAVYGTGNLVLDNATITTTSLSLATGSSNRAILGGTLSMTGGAITRTDKGVGMIDTITSTITGSPTVTFATTTTTDYRGGLYFAPDSGATQTLGAISLVKSAGTSTDKAGLEIGGVSTGNSIASVTNTSAGYGTFRKRGPGEWTVGSINFGSFQNYAGTTIVRGQIDGTYFGTQVFGGTLVLDYTANNNSLLRDAGSADVRLHLLGGTLQLDRSTGATGSHYETVFAVTLSGGAANITRPDTVSTATLRMNGITRNAGTSINFGTANLASTDTTNTNGILGAWATVGGADWAYNSGSTTVGGADASQPNGALDGYIRAYSAYTNVNRLTPGSIADGSTTNVRLVEGSGSSGIIGLGATTTTINTLNQSNSGGTGTATIDTAGKTLAVNGILAGAGSGGLTIGVSTGDGTLRAGTSGGELLVHNYSSNPLTINAVIANNTNPSRLTVTGTGTTILTGINTYTGLTKISGGVLEAAIGTGLSTSTHLQLDGGVLQSSGSFTWANGNNATAGQFNWSGEGGGGFAAKGGKLTVTVGNNAGTEQVWAWVADLANTTLATGNNAILGPMKFGSTTADSEVEFRNNINLNGEVREINVTDNTGSSADFATLSGVIRNSSTVVPAGIYKSGNGTLVLSNANTYNGATNINNGIFAVSGAGSINSTSAINVAAGAKFVYNSATALTVAPVLNGTGTGPGERAVLGGGDATGTNGRINASLTLDSIGDVLAPGNSPGIQTFDVSQNWQSFTYEWELNDWVDSVVGTDIDQIRITGGLTLSGTSYALSIFSLDALNAAGLVGANGGNLFTETSKSWTILTTTTGISGFNASTWTLDTAGFQDAETGNWSLASTGNDLVLSYTVIPEPKAALISGLGILFLFRRRR